MHLVRSFERIESKRGIEWRCADSLYMREFLLLNSKEPVPDHSSLSKIRSRFSLELHHHLGPGGARRCRADPGRPPGIEASTIEVNTAMRSIVRRDIGEDYRQMLKRMAK